MIDNMPAARRRAFLNRVPTNEEKPLLSANAFGWFEKLGAEGTDETLFESDDFLNEPDGGIDDIFSDELVPGAVRI